VGRRGHPLLIVPDYVVGHEGDFFLKTPLYFTAHSRFQEWTEAGVFQKLWTMALEDYDELKGIDWSWQSMDGAMTKAPLGGGKNRPKPYGQGQKRR